MSSDIYLSKEVLNKAIEWFEKNWKNKSCECCNQDQWSLPEFLVSPIPFSDKGYKLGGAALPLLPVVCNNCGNTKFFNALIVGIITKGDATEK